MLLEFLGAPHQRVTLESLVPCNSSLGSTPFEHLPQGRSHKEASRLSRLQISWNREKLAEAGPGKLVPEGQSYPLHLQSPLRMVPLEAFKVGAKRTGREHWGDGETRPLTSLLSTVLEGAQGGQLREGAHFHLWWSVWFLQRGPYWSSCPPPSFCPY